MTTINDVNVVEENNACGSLEKEVAEVSKPTYAILSHEIANIMTADVEYFDQLPGLGKSGALHPTMAKTPKGLYCIDGYEKIEAARAAEVAEIKAEIFELGSHSWSYIGMLKVWNGLVPRGGTPQYANIIWCVQKELDLLINSDEDLMAFVPAEDRDKIKLTGNRAHDAKIVLSHKLKKNKDTLNTYTNHVKYLSDAALTKLIEAMATKAFFGYIQPEKSREVNILKKKGLTEDEITEKISELVLKWHEEYEDNEGHVTFANAAPVKAAPQAITPPEASPSVEKSDQVVLSAPEDPKDEAPGSEPAAPAEDTPDIKSPLGASIKEAAGKVMEIGSKIEAGLPDEELEVELHELNSIVEHMKEIIAFKLTALEKSKAA